STHVLTQIDQQLDRSTFPLYSLLNHPKQAAIFPPSFHALPITGSPAMYHRATYWSGFCPAAVSRLLSRAFTRERVGQG
ncbi:hypothetical protein PMAYCL1PPCAC_18231, partial [Pristionchus mayeri]